MRGAISMLVILGACANIGPFRAANDEAMSDGGMSTDGRGVDGEQIPIDADQTVMPKKLAGVGGEPDALAVTNGYVYWTQLGDYRIGRVAKAGGSSQSIAFTNIPLSFEANGTDVYWVANREIHRTSDGDFTISAALHASSMLDTPLAISATDLYFFYDTAGVSDEQIQKMPRSGGAAQLVRGGLSGPRDLTIEGTTLFSSHDDVLERSALATPTSTTPVASTVFANQLESGGSRVCWVTHPDTNVSTKELWCSKPSGGNIKVTTAQQQFFSIAVTSTHVYWIPQYNDASSEILGYEFATGKKSFVWAPQAGDYVVRLAVDGTSLYWLSRSGANGEIYKLPL